jgi:CRP/FNR family transcriptional regulator
MRQPAFVPSLGDEAVSRSAAVSASLASIFRGRFCDTLLPGRATKTFNKDQVLYELGDEERILFFVRSGVVKTGTITSEGREIIYDLRKDGDVVGELCALDTVRTDRAVALERTEAIPVPFDQVMEVVAQHPELLRDLVAVFGSALSEAYDQVNGLAVTDVMHRLIRVLQGLALKFGRPLGELVEIATYLTQEELSQMVVARRERVSTALNLLRRRGAVWYSPRGQLVIDVQRLAIDDVAAGSTSPPLELPGSVLPP